MPVIEIPYHGEDIVLDPLENIIEKMSDLREEGYSFSKYNFLYALGVSNDYLFDDEDDFCWESLILILKALAPKEKRKIQSSWYEESSDCFYYNLSCGHQYVTPAVDCPPEHCVECGKAVKHD